MSTQRGDVVSVVLASVGLLAGILWTTMLVQRDNKIATVADLKQAYVSVSVSEQHALKVCLQQSEQAQTLSIMQPQLTKSEVDDCVKSVKKGTDEFQVNAVISSMR